MPRRYSFASAHPGLGSLRHRARDNLGAAIVGAAPQLIDYGLDVDPKAVLLLDMPPLLVATMP